MKSLTSKMSFLKNQLYDAGNLFTAGQGLLLLSTGDTALATGIVATGIATAAWNVKNKHNPKNKGSALIVNGTILMGLGVLAGVGMATAVMSGGGSALLSPVSYKTGMLLFVGLGNLLKGLQVNGKNIPKGVPEIAIGLGMFAVAGMSIEGMGKMAATPIAALAMTGIGLTRLKDKEHLSRIPFMVTNAYVASSALLTAVNPITGFGLFLANALFFGGGYRLYDIDKKKMVNTKDDTFKTMSPRL